METEIKSSMAKKAALLLEYEELIKKEELSWRQRSRVLWPKEGDKKTKFFHKMANSHKRYNNIDQLMIQREVSQEPNKIEGEIISYYKLYIESIQWRPINQNARCLVITEEKKLDLQGRFEENKVLNCLKLCATDSSWTRWIHNGFLHQVLGCSEAGHNEHISELL